MAIVDLVMPKMGESIVEATIINWLKNVGDQVQAEEPILEVATDKVDSEVPSTVSGTLVEILHQADDIVPVGGLLARIQTSESEAALNPAPLTSGPQAAPTPPPAPVEPIPDPTPAAAKEPTSTVASAPVAKKVAIPHATVSSNSDGRFYSPLVRNIARTESISTSELDTIPGSGADNRVTKNDLISYIKAKQIGAIAQLQNPLIQHQDASPAERVAPATTPATPTQSKAATSATPTTTTQVKVSAGDEIIEMDRMRRVIAQHMKNSQNTSATVTSMVEADATHLVHWRNRHKVAYQAKYGEKLTFSPLFTEAVIKAIGDYPTINSSIDGNNLITKKDINIGIATAMENGNLIVPVIKKAQDLSLVGLAAKLNDITGRARINALKPDEIQGGTFTISNIGTYGNIMGTPIINQPELAILALGAIKKKPVIQETPHGDIIAIRHMMFLSLSFDHRIIDGYLGGVFLNRIAHYIESFEPNRSI